MSNPQVHGSVLDRARPPVRAQQGVAPAGCADQRIEDVQRDVVAQVKPRLRGWLHAAMTPLALPAGAVLVGLAPTPTGKLGGAVFMSAAVLLFGVSALFHRFNWDPTRAAVLRRIDHANIYLFIAATYTPIALLLLEGRAQAEMLVVVWLAAFGGLLFRVLWLGAPRWLYLALYVAMGSAAIAWVQPIRAASGGDVFILIVLGGGLYWVGALVYGFRWPNPSPRWFGFHEIFHAFTIGAFAAHYAAISMVTYRL